MIRLIAAILSITIIQAFSCCGCVAQVRRAHMADGVYRGECLDYGDSPVAVEVTVVSGRISGIRVLEARDDEYFRMAMGVIPDVIWAQSTEVDAVTGATVSSRAILGAIKDALLRSNVQGTGGEDAVR